METGETTAVKRLVICSKRDHNGITIPLQLLMNSLRKLRIAAKYNLSLPLARKISRLLGSSQVTFVTEMRILKFPEEKVIGSSGKKKLVEKEAGGNQKKG